MRVSKVRKCKLFAEATKRPESGLSDCENDPSDQVERSLLRRQLDESAAWQERSGAMSVTRKGCRYCGRL